MTSSVEDSQPNLPPGNAVQLSLTLNYHLKMLGELVPWTVWFDVNGPATLKSACLESFLTHARLLIEFIAGRPTKKNPMLRNHHKSDFQPATLGFPEWGLTAPTFFDSYLEFMDKHLSHLSLERVEAGGGHSWPIDRIANLLLCEFGTFADRLGDRGNLECAIPISTGVSEAVVLMARTIQWPPDITPTL